MSEPAEWQHPAAVVPLATLLRARRAELGLTLQEVADRMADVGVTVQRQTVNTWETRGGRPDKYLKALAHALELKPALLKDSVWEASR
tara:strand:+ start:994 stop:1257 length:264 start_codon:yes stop_codon:yes gene_type:complete